MGISEQMRDDYQDLFGDAKAMGKPTGTDIRDGRRNYAVRAVLTAATDSERAVVEACLGDPHCAEEAIAAVREVAERHGVRGKLRSDMARHAELAAAEAAAWRPRWREEAVAFFERLPVWSVERPM
ncbi:polyprenyl synthetase family protein [Streptomyces sp. NPDC002990]